MKKIVVFAIVIFLLGFWGFVELVPPNMDEFIKYHRLACWSFNGSAYSILQEGCDKYSASVFGFQFHRNYQYIGVISNFLYAPFYYLAPNIYSHYAFGLVLLLFFSILLVKSLEVKWVCIFIPLTFFPIIYLMIHDHGPASLSLITYPIFFLLIQKLFAEHLSLNKYIFLSIGIAVTLLIGLDEKVFYLYLIPQILILSLSVAIYRQRGIFSGSDLGSIWPALIGRMVFLGSIILFVTAGFLFLIKTDGVNYFRYLVELKKIQSREVPISLADIHSGLIQFISIPYSYPHRIFHLNEGYKIISQLVFAPVLLICIYTAWRCKNYLAIGLLILSELVTVGIFILTKNVWASHHFIFLQIPIVILLMLFANSSAKSFLVSILLLCVNLFMNLALLNNSAVQGHAKLIKNGVFEYLSQDEIAKSGLINFSSFGGYFILSLYGNKDQVVTWKDLKNSESGRTLINLSKKASKEYIFNACEGCTVEQIQFAFPNATIEQVGPHKDSWRVWKIAP